MTRCEFCAASLPAGGELCEPCEADHAEAVAQDRRDPDRERAAWMRLHQARMGRRNTNQIKEG